MIVAIEAGQGCQNTIDVVSNVFTVFNVVSQVMELRDDEGNIDGSISFDVLGIPDVAEDPFGGISFPLSESALVNRFKNL